MDNLWNSFPLDTNRDQKNSQKDGSMGTVLWGVWEHPLLAQEAPVLQFDSSAGACQRRFLNLHPTLCPLTWPQDLSPQTLWTSRTAVGWCGPLWDWQEDCTCASFPPACCPTRLSPRPAAPDPGGTRDLSLPPGTDWGLPRDPGLPSHWFPHSPGWKQPIGHSILLVLFCLSMLEEQGIPSLFRCPETTGQRSTTVCVLDVPCPPEKCGCTLTTWLVRSHEMAQAKASQPCHGMTDWALRMPQHWPAHMAPWCPSAPAASGPIPTISPTTFAHALVQDSQPRQKSGWGARAFGEVLGSCGAPSSYCPQLGNLVTMLFAG